MLKFKSLSKKEKVKIPLREIISAELPSAISARINPLLSIGAASALLSIFILLFKSLRSISPFFLALGLLLAGYALWQKQDVLTRGYDEYLFRVIDYTSFAPSFMREMVKPTGLLLLNRTEGIEEDSRVYHVATSGKGRDLPPIDWLIRVYVPKGTVPAEYGDRKYFPIVYGYKIEGDDRK